MIIDVRNFFIWLQFYTKLSSTDKAADLNGRLSILMRHQSTPELTRRLLTLFITRERNHRANSDQ